MEVETDKAGKDSFKVRHAPFPRAESTAYNHDETQVASPLDYDKQHCAELVKRWGGSASITLIDEHCQVFTAPGIEGMIGYKSEPGCVVVYGDPVCSPQNLSVLTNEFHQFCEKNGKRIVYISASQRFADWAMGRVCKAMLEFGEELAIDPAGQEDPSLGSQGRMLRKKMNHALHEGVVVKEYSDYDQSLEKEIEKVGQDWLKARNGLQIYLAHVHILKDRSSQRWIYAELAGKVVGVAVLSKLEALQGWLLYLLMTTPNAPHGTSELLIMKARQVLREEGCHYLTFGAVTAPELGQVVGLGKITETLARKVFILTKKVFHLDGRRDFWKKFQPQSESSYALFSHAGLGVREFYAVLHSLNVSL